MPVRCQQFSAQPIMLRPFQGRTDLPEFQSPGALRDPGLMAAIPAGLSYLCRAPNPLAEKRGDSTVFDPSDPKGAR